MRFIFIILFILAGCREAPQNAAHDKDVITRLSDSEISGLDPQKVSDLSSLRIAMDQFEGLVRFDAGGKPIAGLAQSWSVSEDGLTWRFKLKSGIIFSDDVPIRAHHFTRGFDRLYADATASPHLALFDIIGSVKESGNDVVITLKSPFPQLLELLAHPAMAALPLHAMDKDWTAMRPMISSGPYQLSKWQLGDELLLEPNPKWHDERGHDKNISWKVMSDSVTAMRTFLSGAADTTSDVPPNRLPSLRDNESLKIGEFLGTYYYAYNTRKEPFDDVRVRKALSMVIDRDWIADELMKSGNTPAFGLLPSDLMDGAIYRPAWAGWSIQKRQAEARKMLAQAGYNNDKPLRFEIRFNSSNEHRRASVAMASMWRDIGAEVALLNSEASLHFASLRRHDFTLARSGWIADIAAPENFLNVHRISAGASNYSGFDDAQYEKLLEDASQESDPLKRMVKMRNAEAYLMEQAPIIPLYHYVSRALVSKRLNGWRNNISNIHPSISLIKGQQ